MKVIIKTGKDVYGNQWLEAKDTADNIIGTARQEYRNSYATWQIETDRYSSSGTSESGIKGAAAAIRTRAAKYC